MLDLAAAGPRTRGPAWRARVRLEADGVVGRVALAGELAEAGVREKLVVLKPQALQRERC